MWAQVHGLCGAVIIIGPWAVEVHHCNTGSKGCSGAAAAADSAYLLRATNRDELLLLDTRVSSRWWVSQLNAPIRFEAHTRLL